MLVAMHLRALLLVAVAACAGKSALAPAPQPAPAPAAPAPRAPAPWESITGERMMADVEWLCAPERKGRGYYQDGGRAASDWVADQFRDAGLEVTRQLLKNGADNVIGIRHGDDMAVIVSAHYDHLGEDENGAVYPGADDNASGVAAMLAILRSISDLDEGHTVIFIAFGAEEDGLLGSNTYVHDPIWPLERTLVVINFDMVGRNLFELIGDGRPSSVGVVGLEASELHRAVTERAARAEAMALLSGSAKLVARFGFDGRTDDWWFRQKGVKTIHFSTGLQRDYHKTTDTPDRLRPGQMERVAKMATRVVVELAELGAGPYDSE